MHEPQAKAQLIRILRAAYSGERAAANAYRGHARSVRDPAQRAAIRAIEADEREHRRRVGEVLAELGGSPGRVRDVLMGWLGWAIAASCFLGGWFIPMYGAGKIESRNIREYEHAAALADACGLPELADELLGMAELEWDHEAYFRGLCEGHWMLRVLRLWPAPPPRAAIRAPKIDAKGR